MPRCDPILIDCDCSDPHCPVRFRLSDLIRVVCTWTDDPDRQKALVEAWLRGYQMASVHDRTVTHTPVTPFSATASDESGPCSP